MAKRGRAHAGSLTSLAQQLDRLNAERARVIQQIQQALSVENPFPFKAASDGGMVSSGRRGKGGRRKGYKMSAATKAKLRAAWKRRKAAAAG